MVAGRLNKQIAEGLGISIKTVEQHRSRVMEKLQVDSSAELVRLVVSIGWSAEPKNGPRGACHGQAAAPARRAFRVFPDV